MERASALPEDVSAAPPGAAENGDKLHEECGVFGIWNGADAAAVTALGLPATQPRGPGAASRSGSVDVRAASGALASAGRLPRAVPGESRGRQVQARQAGRQRAG